MKKLFETITVPLAPEQAFAYTANFANIEQWDPGVAASEKLDSGPLDVGTRFRVLVKSGLSTTEMEYRVTRLEAPHRIELEGSGGNIHAIDEILFTQTGGGTQIDYSAEISLGGLAGTVEPLLHRSLERIGRQALAGLETALSETPAAPPESGLRDLLDRLVLPGAAGFTRYGYQWKKRNWQAFPARLEGQTVIITGATSGLGRVAAERLACLGGHVVLIGRNRQKLEAAQAAIRAAAGHDRVDIETADLGLMAEVRALSQRLLERYPEIHVLVNNAAVLPVDRSQTSEGLETAFATDLLSPFLLTELLMPRLRASAPARIVNVLSGGMYLSGVRLDDLQSSGARYDGARAYAQAKRGLMWLTEHWNGQLEGSGVVVNAMHPGWADTPGVKTSLPGFHRVTRNLLRTPEQGADTIVWLAAAAEAGNISGKFWLDREPHLSAILPGTAGNAKLYEQLHEQLHEHVTRLAA